MPSELGTSVGSTVDDAHGDAHIGGINSLPIVRSVSPLSYVHGSHQCIAYTIGISCSLRACARDWYVFALSCLVQVLISHRQI